MHDSITSFVSLQQLAEKRILSITDSEGREWKRVEWSESNHDLIKRLDDFFHKRIALSERDNTLYIPLEAMKRGLSLPSQLLLQADRTAQMRELLIVLRKLSRCDEEKLISPLLTQLVKNFTLTQFIKEEPSVAIVHHKEREFFAVNEGSLIRIGWVTRLGKGSYGKVRAVGDDIALKTARQSYLKDVQTKKITEDVRKWKAKRATIHLKEEARGNRLMREKESSPLFNKEIPVKIYGKGVVKERLGLLSERFGDNLLKILRKNFQERFTYGYLMVKEIASMQRRHLTHSDLKLENFVIDERAREQGPNNSIRIIDNVALASTLNDDSMEEAAVTIATFPYHLRFGTKTQSDSYATTVALLELLTGKSCAQPFSPLKERMKTGPITLLCHEETNKLKSVYGVEIDETTAAELLVSLQKIDSTITSEEIARLYEPAFALSRSEEEAARSPFNALTLEREMELLRKRLFPS